MRRQGSRAWLCLLLLGATLPSPADELPPDAPVSAEVVHQLKYPWSGRNHLQVTAAFLNGDKFLASYGLVVEDHYFISESLAIGVGVGFFQSSVSDEAQALAQAGVPPRMHNPVLLGKLTALYDPIYGKFVLGSHLQRFKLGLELGAQITQDRIFYTDSGPSESRSVIGPLGGVHVTLPLSGTFTASLSVALMLQSSWEGMESGGLRQLWLFGAGVGCRL